MEGTSGATLTVYDEAALCSSTFKILRGMVHTWMNEASNYDNFYADLQLQHFYRCPILCAIWSYGSSVKLDSCIVQTNSEEESRSIN